MKKKLHNKQTRDYFSFINSSIAMLTPVSYTSTSPSPSPLQLWLTSSGSVNHNKFFVSFFVLRSEVGSSLDEAKLC